MKPIIVTYSNESWYILASFGTSAFMCIIMGGCNMDMITTKDIKLIARPKK